MTGGRAGALGILDDAADALRRIASATALLWFTSLPLRFLQVWFAVHLLRWGPRTSHYGTWLLRCAAGIVAAWVLAQPGRFVFASSCREALATDRDAPRPLARFHLRAFAAYLGSALVLEALFWVGFVTVIVPLLAGLLSSLLVAGVPARSSGLWAPLRALRRETGSLGRIVLLLPIFAAAFALVLVNLWGLSIAALKAAEGLPGANLAGWSRVVLGWNSTYVVLLAAAATLLLEPLWLASLVAHVDRIRVRSSGDDLRRWFAAVRDGETT